jgi:hypothetical protein
MRLERVGTALVGCITVVTLLVVGTSVALRLAASDLYARVDDGHGVAAAARTQPGVWLSSHLSSDVASSDLVALRARADQLDARGDRVREMAGVVAVVGLLVAVLTGQAGATGGRAREPSIAAANTANNGTA